MPPYLLIGIDTEPDDQWTLAGRQRLACSNIHQLDRLHAAFRSAGARPTYFVTYAVAADARSVDLLGRWAQGGEAEIGAHHHAWDTPPFGPDDIRDLPYTMQLPAGRFEQQLAALTERIAASFGARPTSYRSGRLGLSAAHVAPLERRGYVVDSSVAPLVNESHKGGPDYTDIPADVYWLSYESLAQPGRSRVLEVPISSGLSRRLGATMRRLYGRAPFRYQTRRVLRLSGLAEQLWLRPTYSSLAQMEHLARRLVDDGVSILNATLHSSEAAVGTSPYVKTAAELDEVIDACARFCRFAIEELGATPVTFAELHERHAGAGR